MAELTLIASLGGIVALTFLHLRRTAAGDDARYWAWAWLALWVSGLMLGFDPVHRVFGALAAGLGSTFAIFLFAGAREYAGLRLPAWLWPAAVALAVTRAGLHWGGAEEASYAAALSIETAFALAAAGTLARRTLRDPGASLPQRLLGPALVVLGGVHVADLVFRLRSGGIPLGLLFAWAAAGFTLALLQILAIVDRLRAGERRLRRESERLSDIVERTSDLVGIADGRGRPTYLNRAGRALLGLPPEGELAATPLPELAPPEEDRETAVGASDRESKDLWQGETTVRHRPTDTHIPVSQVRIAQRGEAGRTSGYATIMRDLSGRVASERAVHRQAREVALLRAIAAEALAHDDVPTLLAAVLPGLREHLDTDASVVWHAAASGEPLALVDAFGLPEDVRQELRVLPTDRALVNRALVGRTPVFSRDALRDPGMNAEAAARAGVRAVGFVPLVHPERVVGMLGVARRRPEPFGEAERELLVAVGEELALAVEHVQSLATVRRQAAELSAERRTLRALLDTAPVGVLLVDGSGRIRLMSRIAAQHYGGTPEEWTGRPFAELSRTLLARAEDPDPLQEAIERTESDPHRVVEDLELRLAGPEERTLALFSSPVLADGGARLGRVFVTRDVTTERRLEEDLRQAQKMETLGTLAGGVAHDYNNLLTVVLGNARLALEAAPEESSLRTALLDLERAGEHCAGLTRSLLAFARRAPLETRPVAPGALLEEVARLMRGTLSGKLDLRVDPSGELPRALADATQLQQVLLNLCVNARDALGERGCIRMSAVPRQVGEGAAVTNPDARAGSYVEFRVVDDGPGLDAWVRERIFDPFFSTKPLGSGTGLGLAVAYGVVRSHGGWIEVESEPGRGTTFRVLLPSAGTEASASDAPEPVPPDEGRGETVLFADDEPLVRRLGRTALERAGYVVVEASDGEEAVERFREHGAGGVDLLVLDLSMPRKGGEEALQAIRALAPGVPALLASGHFDPERPDLGENVEELAKPYRPATLLARVREALDARSEA